jgi:hypothetical protein
MLKKIKGMGGVRHLAVQNYSNQPMSAFKCFIIQMFKVRVGDREKQNGAV